MSPSEESTKAVIDEIAGRIRSGRRFLITAHRNPDGDAIGSALALRRILIRLDKEAKILVRDAFSPPLKHVPGIEEVEFADTLPPDYPAGWDGLFTMECPERERCGYAILPGPVINVDHHIGNTGYGEVNYVDVDAPSVGEMLLVLADTLGVTVDEAIATPIYVSLASDTGFFRYTNTSLRALEAAVRLVEAGADPGAISLWINESVPAATIRIQSLCGTTLQIHEGVKVATMEMSLTMLAEAGASPEDVEGVASLGRTIDGVLVSAFLKEAEGGTRVSMRAKPGADVQRVASRFGGGGHKAASGCTIPRPMAEAKRVLLDAIREMLAKRETAR